MGKEVGERILQSVEVNALLLTNPANMRFVAGFTGEGYVYISEKQCLVVTDSRYTIAASKDCSGFQVIEWNGKGYYTPLMEALKNDSILLFGIEDEEMTVSRYQKLRMEMKKNELGEIKIKSLQQNVTRFRQVKSEDEIRKIKKAEAIGDRAFARILPKLRNDLTEKQVAAWLEFTMKEAGADGFSFDTIAASGLNSAMPHAVPTNKVLEKGDFLTMDFGCILDGYCSDMTRTVVIGKASREQKKVYDTVLFAQEKALACIKPGMTGKEVDAIARKVIEDAGYGDDFGHSLGHSVGLEIHEKPTFSPSDDTVLVPGMVITVEPGIYIENFGGVRIEDVVVITENGCENITKSPKELIEIERS